MDGRAEQFAQGQSITEPGLIRTPFGIPAECLPIVDFCAGGVTLTWFEWAVDSIAGVELADSHFDMGRATFDIGPLWGVTSAYLDCSSGTIDFPDYRGPLLHVTFPTGGSLAYYVQGVYGPEPTYNMGLSPSPADVTWYRLRKLPP